MKSRGDSGLDITQVMDDKITIVGVNPNVYPSCRIDGSGRSKEVIVSSASEGVRSAAGAYTEHEAIDNSGDHHGGNYSIITMNKFNVDSGAGGIHLTSFGNVNIMAAGGLTNILATDCVSAISNVVKIVASENTVIKGPELYIDTKSTTFTNTVKFAKNLIVKGGMMLNGELYVNHMTIPHQIRDTSMSPVLPVYFNTPTVLKGIITQRCFTPIITEGGPAVPQESSSWIEFTLDPTTTMIAQGKVLPHHHTYKHAACTFTESPTDIWEEVSNGNEDEIMKAKSTGAFGEAVDKVVGKVRTRLINSFTDTLTALMGNIF